MRNIKTLTVLLMLVLVVAAAAWIFQTRSAESSGPTLLKKRIAIFPSNRWRLDWSWDAKFSGRRTNAPLVAKIKAFGGVAFRDAGRGDPIRLPDVGFLSIVLDRPDPGTLDAIIVGLHDGANKDLEPVKGVSALSPSVHRDGSIPRRIRLSIPLSCFSPRGARVGKINIMNNSSNEEAIAITIHDVSLLPADEESERRITCDR